MSTFCNTTMQEGGPFFGHLHEHWPLVNSLVINAALRLKRLPTPDLEKELAEIKLKQLKAS